MSCIGFSWMSAAAAAGSYSASSQPTGPTRKARTRPPPSTPVQSVKKKVSSARLVRQALNTRDSGNVEQKSASAQQTVDSDKEAPAASGGKAAVNQGSAPSLDVEPPPPTSKTRTNEALNTRTRRKAPEQSTSSAASDSGNGAPVPARARSKPRKKVRARKQQNVPASEAEPPPSPLSEAKAGTNGITQPTTIDGHSPPSEATSAKVGAVGNGSDNETRSEDASGKASQPAAARRKTKRKRRTRTVLSSVSIPFDQQKKQLPEEERVRLKPRGRRSRSYTPSSNRTFSSYMDEITASGLLQQQEVVRLSAEIRAGVAIEEKQRQLADKMKRNASLLEVAEELNVTVEHVRHSLLRGKAAKNRMVSSNLRLVTSVCRRMSSSRSRKVTVDGAGGARSVGTGLSLDDMIQEGSMGLIRAAEKFDGSKGYKFSTYATWWIKAAVMRGITSQSRSIRVPSTIVDEYNRIRREYERRRAAGERTPSEEVVAETLGMTAGKLRFVVQSVMRTTASLDLNVRNTDGTGSKTLVELIEGDDNVEERMVEEMQKKELDGALKLALVPIERVIIRLRFGLDDGHPRTLEEIGRMVGISKERVRQLVFKSLGKLNTAEMRERLDAYLAGAA